MMGIIVLLVVKMVKNVEVPYLLLKMMIRVVVLNL